MDWLKELTSIVLFNEFAKVPNSGSVDQQYSQHSPGVSVASLSSGFPNQVLNPVGYSIRLTVESFGAVREISKSPKYECSISTHRLPNPV